jgi:Sulfotransferase family
VSQLARIPDFFVVGAPKCGTSALCSYLGRHPCIFMSPMKEPHYFYREGRTSPNRIGGFMHSEHYSNLFRNALPNQLCGEGSTFYMFSRFAIPDILTANPDAKLIAMVRNPLDMMMSFHRQVVNAFLQDELDFDVAWKLSDARAEGRSLPPDCRAPERLNYKAVGRLGEQVERLLGIARPEQVHIIVFDDFVSDTSEAYRGVIEFLGLPDPGVMEFPVVNAHRELLAPRVAKFLNQPPFPLKQGKALLRRHWPLLLLRVAKPIRRINTRYTTKPEVSAKMKREMAKEFGADIQLLARLLDRDLSHWYKHAL